MNNKIIHVISEIKKEGPVEALYYLTKEMKKTNSTIEVEIYSFGFSNTEYLNRFLELEIEVNIVSEIYFLNKFLGKKNIIFHSHCTKSILLSTIVGFRSIKIHSCQIILGLQSKSMHGYLKGYVINTINKFLYYLQNHLIFSSKSVKNSINKILQKKGIIIYNHVEKSTLLKQTNQKNYLVTISRLSPEKNISQLIKFFSKLENQNLELLIVGDGPEMNKLKSISKNNSRIKFLGFLDEIDNVINTSLIYLSSSKTEGLPISILKALSLGKPLLLSNIGPHQELINNNGFLYNLNSFSDFENKLNLILKDVDKYSKESISLFEKKFDTTKLTLKYINFIQSL